MKLLKSVLKSEGWYLTGYDVPIQLGVKVGNSYGGEPHLHKSMHEYFVILKGQISISVKEKTIKLNKGDLLIVEPGEPHEMISKSPDCQYLILMPKYVPNDKVDLKHIHSALT